MYIVGIELLVLGHDDEEDRGPVTHDNVHGFARQFDPVLAFKTDAVAVVPRARGPQCRVEAAVVDVVI